MAEIELESGRVKVHAVMNDPEFRILLENDRGYYSFSLEELASLLPNLTLSHDCAILYPRRVK